MNVCNYNYNAIKLFNNNNDYINNICCVNKNVTINIICYCVNTSEKYPFIQFMLTNTSNANEIDLPNIVVNNSNNSNNLNVKNSVICYIKEKLNNININNDLINITHFQGLFQHHTNNNEDNNNENNNNEDKIYAMVNISDIELKYLKMTIYTECIFALPYEIVNVKYVFNKSIAENVTNLFLKIPTLFVLTIPNTTICFNLPEIGYIISDKALSEFQLVLGLTKTNNFVLNDTFYICYRHSISNNLHTKFTNRFALFIDNYYIHIEDKDILSLTNNQVNKLLCTYSCIFVQWTNNNKTLQNVILKYDTYVSLSMQKS